MWRPELPRRTFFAFLAPFLLLGDSVRADQETVSDDDLYDLVNRKLITDPDLGARQLQVKVEQGVVTVAGFVESEKMQKKVERVVRKVKGVKDVVNQTKIREGL